MGEEHQGILTNLVMMEVQDHTIEQIGDTRYGTLPGHFLTADHTLLLKAQEQ